MNSTTAPAAIADPIFETDFIREMARQMRALDSYGQYDGKPVATMLEQFVLSKERKAEIPVIGVVPEDDVVRLAVACAEAGVFLISPFVGRILDWYKKAENVSSYPVEQDPGVLSVKQIYHYYKQRSVKTEIMGASFRSIDQVLGLAGCDLLTVAPNLLAELEQDTREVQLQLSEKQAQAFSEQLFDTLDRESFKALLEHDLMAFQLLQSGIDGFIKAREQLSTLLRQSFGYDAEIQA